MLNSTSVLFLKGQSGFFCLTSHMLRPSFSMMRFQPEVLQAFQIQLKKLYLRVFSLCDCCILPHAIAALIEDFLIQKLSYTIEGHMPLYWVTEAITDQESPARRDCLEVLVFNNTTRKVPLAQCWEANKWLEGWVQPEIRNK